ncbi:MAG: hypothetical protein ACE5IO_06335 [Thermoplasmata archaeon]
MGYEDLYHEFKCENCGVRLSWFAPALWTAGHLVRCPDCDKGFYIGAPPDPNLPPVLYAGPEKLARVKLTPLPPKQVVYTGHGEYHSWKGAGDCMACPFAIHVPASYGAPVDCGSRQPEEMQPFSVRAVLSQLAMRTDSPCRYFVLSHGKDDFGNVQWEEGCMDPCSGCDYRPHMGPCHLVSGWIHGEDTCEGWDYLGRLCQSDNERRFLHQYLRVNHDREYPMPIPQAHIEITERIRVDFVMFVPITRFKWKWLAIEIDSEKWHQDSDKEFQRNMLLESEGYEVIHLPAEKMMLDQVRDLYAKVTDIQTAIRKQES